MVADSAFVPRTVISISRACVTFGFTAVTTLLVVQRRGALQPPKRRLLSIAIVLYFGSIEDSPH